MDRIKIISLTAVLIVTSMACTKSTIEEEVKFPKKVELLVGQYCLPQVVIEEVEYVSGTVSQSHSSSQALVDINGDTINYSSSSADNNTTHKTYIFKEWASSQPDVAEIRGDTLVALSCGESELTALYQDFFGNHSVNCSITVSDIVIPTSEDTIYSYIGDTVVLCKMDIPGRYTIEYDLLYGDGYCCQSTLDDVPANQESPDENSPLTLSPVYTYYLNYIVPDQGLASLHIFCDLLSIDVTIPIVMLPSDESKGL